MSTQIYLRIFGDKENYFEGSSQKTVVTEDTYQKTIKSLSTIWSTKPASISYITASEWINLNIDRIQEVIRQRLNRSKKNTQFKTTEMLTMYIISDIERFKETPKWLVILESLFKLNVLTIQTIEPLVLKSDLEKDTKFRQMMIYFIVLTNSLGLTNDPNQSGKWSLIDFALRASWLRKHIGGITRIFNLRKSSHRTRQSNLDQTIFLANQIFLKCTGTKFKRFPSKIRKSGNHN